VCEILGASIISWSMELI